MKNLKQVIGYPLLLVGILGPAVFFLYFQRIGSNLAPGEAAGLGFGFVALSSVTFVLFFLGAIFVGGIARGRPFAFRSILICLGILEYATPFLTFPIRIYIALIQSYPFAGIGLTVLVLYLLSPLLLKYFGNTKQIPKTVQVICLVAVTLLCLYQFSPFQ